MSADIVARARFAKAKRLALLITRIIPREDRPRIRWSVSIRRKLDAVSGGRPMSDETYEMVREFVEVSE